MRARHLHRTRPERFFLNWPFRRTLVALLALFTAVLITVLPVLLGHAQPPEMSYCLACMRSLQVRAHRTTAPFATQHARSSSHHSSRERSLAATNRRPASEL